MHPHDNVSRTQRHRARDNKSGLTARDTNDGIIDGLDTRFNPTLNNGRTGIPLSLEDNHSSILSPLLSNFPSISGISTIKGFLPTSHSKQTNGTRIDPSPSRPLTAWAYWQYVDLNDGQGKRHLLLVSSPGHALQIFAYRPGTIPDDPHVAEVFPAPEEIVSIPKIVYARSTEKSGLPGISPLTDYRDERVLSARLFQATPASSSRSKWVVAVITSMPVKRPADHGHLALVILELQSGEAVRRIDLGVGLTATLFTSARFLAIATSHPTPSIHILDSSTYRPSHSSITNLPCDPRTSLPVMDLSGRLLALATDEPASTPGADGLGSIVTAHSTIRSLSARLSTFSGSPLDSPNQSTAQTALLTSAAEIGGGVARGVWAGLKMGVRAAGRASGASGTRLARSAPAESGRSLSEEEALVESEESERRSVEEDVSFQDASLARAALSEGHWIKILDIFPQKRGESNGCRHRNTENEGYAKIKDQLSTDQLIDPALIAHFRLPPSHTLLSPLGADYSPKPNRNTRHRRSETHDQPVARILFSPQGTQLFAAPADGRSFHVLEVRPAPASRGTTRRDRHGRRSHEGEMRIEIKGEVWHLYELRRGNTAADVCSVTWSEDARWIAVGTGKGTVHVFAVCPYGGIPTAASHVSTRITNQVRLYPLSTPIYPVVRLRPPKIIREGDDLTNYERSSGVHAHAVPSFVAQRAHPHARGVVCNDVAVFRLGLRQLEIARLSARAVVSDSKVIGSGEGVKNPSLGLTNTSMNVNGAVKKRSNLTEMMKERAGLVRDSDLAVEHTIKSRWAIPLGDGVLALLNPGLRGNDARLPPRRQSEPGNRQISRSFALAHAEIQTHSTSLRVLPGSIYLSRQISFFSAVPTDEYTPLSVLDREARTGRLIFRHEVEARSASPDVQSFDEPLSSALHSIIEARPQSQLPHLPNGYPGRPKWTTVPIRHAVVGLGEGVDRFRREYVRHQHSRIRRRASEAAGNKLDFEEGTVFPSRDEAQVADLVDCNTTNGPYAQGNRLPTDSLDLDGENDVCSEDVSSRSSAMLPASSADGEGEGPAGGEEGDEGWGEGWEEEYRRAVEDDGGPDDLVLGVMDEEEEDRARWEMRQKVLAKQYA